MPLDLNKLAPTARAHIEQNARWVQIYPWGTCKHPQSPGGAFTVNKEFYQELVRFMEDHRGIYFTPVTANHHIDPAKGPQEEGVPTNALNYGRTVDLREGAGGIEALAYFAKGVATQLDEGYIDSLSPTHYNGFYSTKTGKYYKTGLQDLSIVKIRHQKGLPGASPWYQLSEQELSAVALTEIKESVMPQDTTTAANPTNQISTANAATSQPAPLTLEKVSEMINAATSPMTTQLSEIAALLKPTASANAETDASKDKARIAELERKVELGAARDKVRGALPGADDATVTKLSEVIMAAPTGFDAVIAPYKKLAELERAKGAPDATALSEVGGVTNNAQGGAGAKMTYAQAKAKAVAAGIKPGPDTAQWIRTTHPEVFVK